MARTHEEMLNSISATEREAVAQRVEELKLEELTLRELRKARDLTQTRLAETLKTSQDGISKLEQRSDLLLSTLRSYIEAMGGKLQLIASFPGKAPVSVAGFSQIDDSRIVGQETPPTPRR